MAKMVRRVLLGASVVAMALGGLAIAPSEAGSFTPVDIHVEMDLPYCCSSAGPIEFDVTGVAPGPGPELSGADVTANPSSWCGSLFVDVDPTTDTITVSPDEPCDFEVALVTVSGPWVAQFDSASTIGDNLWQPDPPMARTGPTVVGGVFSVSWDNSPAGDSTMMQDGGSAAFQLGRQQTTTTSTTTTTTSTTSTTSTTAPPAAAAQPTEGTPTFTG